MNVEAAKALRQKAYKDCDIYSDRNVVKVGMSVGTLPEQHLYQAKNLRCLCGSILLL